MIAPTGRSLLTDVSDVDNAPLLTAGDRLPSDSGPRRGLRVLLVMVDLASALAAWSLAFGFGAVSHDNHVSTIVRGGAAAVALTVLMVALAGYEKLYLARVCSVRSFELSRLLLVALISGVAAPAVARAVGMHLPSAWAAFGAGSLFILDASARWAYSRWLRSGRINGRFSRPVVLVGDNEEAIELYELTQEHPESGLRVVGIVGQPGATVSPIAGLP